MASPVTTSRDTGPVPSSSSSSRPLVLAPEHGVPATTSQTLPVENVIKSPSLKSTDIVQVRIAAPNGESSDAGAAHTPGELTSQKTSADQPSNVEQRASAATRAPDAHYLKEAEKIASLSLLPTQTLRSLTAKDVALHKTRDDLWLIIDGDVYDLTAFQDEHPDGAKILMPMAGKDATKKFDKYHCRAILQHDRHNMLKIGSVVPEQTGAEFKGVKTGSGRSIFTRLRSWRK